MNNFATSIEIGILIYPEAQQAAVLGMTDLFAIANRFVSSSQTIRVSHWQLSEHSDIPECVLDTQPNTGTNCPTVIIFPPTLGEPLTHQLAQRYKAWLQQLHQGGTILASVCAGAFALAEIGLLDGRQATTHWNYEERFRQQFPKVNLDIDRLIIDQGDIITAGGAMAWTDLCLKLLDRFLGASVMINTAQILLVDPPKREQSYYSVFSPNLMHGDTAILKLQHWLQETDAKEIKMTRLADIAGLHERTLQRRFSKATGLAPLEYCQRLRVTRAREFLQFSRLSIESIAWEVGYQDVGAFRKVFSHIVGLSPGEYRKRFSGSIKKD